MQISARLLSKLLNLWPVARLASVAPDNQAHIVPIVFCLHDNALYSPLDGKRKSGSRLKRIDNITSNPAVSLLLDEYATDWEQLWWVRLDGKAEKYVPPHGHATMLETLLRKKYPQYADIAVLKDEAIYLRITWTQVSTWAQGDLETSIQRALGVASATARA